MIFTCATISFANGIWIGVAFPSVRFIKSAETIDLEVPFDNLWS